LRETPVSGLRDTLGQHRAATGEEPIDAPTSSTPPSEDLQDGKDGRTLSERLFEVLKREIITGALPAGEIVNEPELAARYAVSKTPVREALRLLVYADWVVTLPRKGYLVRPLSLSDIREVFAVRRILEPPLAAEAAKRADEKAIADLRANLAEQAAASDDFDRATDCARAFHVMIAEKSGNHRGARMASALIDEVVRLVYHMPRLEATLSSLAELEAHKRIVEAIERRDSPSAETLVREHIVNGGRVVTKVFTEDL
jgi:DNA-binding GntR family transcriptional regulator